MRKILSLLLTVCSVAYFSVSCTPGDKKQSLSLSPASLEFEASVNESKEVSVIAENVDWSFEVASAASGWLEAKKEGKGLVVTVKDNTRAEGRVGIIKVIPDSSELSAKEIIVSQKGSSDPVTPEIIISPSSLTFEGENATSQEVTVTMRGDGFTWTAIPGEAVKDWISVESHDGKIIITVADNPLGKERSGIVDVIPSEKGIAAKSVLVTQKGKVEVASLSVDKPNGLTFASRDKGEQRLNVSAVNCNWGVAARDENGVGVMWVSLSKMNTDDEKSVTVSVEPNVSDERVAYVVLTALGKDDGKPIESVPIVKVKITQSKGKPAISSLEEDVEFTAANYTSMLYAFMDWDKTAPKTSLWQFDFADGTFKINKDSWPYTLAGTGNRLCFDMHSPKMLINEENVYYIPVEKDYDIFVKDSGEIESPEYTFDSGREYDNNTGDVTRTSDSSDVFKYGAWYMRVENGAVKASAPIVEGTLKIEHISKFNYKITLTGKDDAGNTINMSFQGDMENINQVNAWDPEPGGGEKPEVPEWPNNYRYRR